MPADHNAKSRPALESWRLAPWERLLAPLMSAEHFEKAHSSGLLDADGGVPSPRVDARADHACEVPFGFQPAIAAGSPVACIIHAFYPDMLPPLLALLPNVPRPVDLFISTDTAEKKAEIELICRVHMKSTVEVRITENRGRDIAPKLIAFKDVYPRYDLFLHLHTKRSPHSGSLALWSRYLAETLIGSPAIAAAILKLFEDPRMGLVFPQHLFTLRKALRWGFNYDHGRRLLGRLGIKLRADWPLEFPSGSMIWGRSAALKPLLDLGLSVEDFPEEAGQVDGTLAHAIERCLLHVVEHAGFEWLKIARCDLYPLRDTVLPVPDEEALAGVKARVFQPCLPKPTFNEPPSAPAPVRLTAGKGARLRLIRIEHDESGAAGGVRLWQRRDPVEAARWRLERSDEPSEFAARLVLEGREPHAASAWADAIENAVARFKSGG